MIDTKGLVITRRRKKYKFAVFASYDNCYEVSDWQSLERIDMLEIGAGSGTFSLAVATGNPGAQIVAVDVKADRLQVAAGRALAEQVSNVTFVRAHVDQLREKLRPGSVRDIWLTFSDPFPKDRHAKHRLSHPRFLELYAQFLDPKQGRLLIKTDNHAFFDWTLEQLIAAGWRITELSYDLHNSDVAGAARILTTYEQKFLKQGLPTHYVAAVPPNS